MAATKSSLVFFTFSFSLHFFFIDCRFLLHLHLAHFSTLPLTLLENP